MKLHPLILRYHTIDSWVAASAAVLHGLGCSPAHIAQYEATARERYELGRKL